VSKPSVRRSSVTAAPAATPRRGQGNPSRGVSEVLRRGWGPGAIGKTLIPVSIAGLLALSEDSAAQSRYPVQRTETISRTLQTSGAGDRVIEISTINGSIRVVGHDDHVVEMVVRKSVRAASDRDADDAERAVTLEVGETTSAIHLRGHAEAQPGCDWETVTRRRSEPRYTVSFDFDVRVPRGARLRLCTVNGGDVHVAATAGDFDIDNVNGAITLTAIRGSGRAVTVNGRVTAEFAQNPKSPSLFKSVNGDIDVVLQRGLAADLLMKTFNGGLFTDFDATPFATPVAAAERRNGMRVYSANRFSRFRVGSGGPELTFDAFNGDIRVVGSR
jgi:hypothetical protein